MNVLDTIFIKNNAKAWMQVAYAVSTYKIMTTPLSEMSDFIFIGWFSVVGGVELFKRAMAARLEQQPNRGGWNGRQDCNSQGLPQRSHRGIRPDGSREEVSRPLRRGDDEGTHLQATEGVVR